MSIARPPPTERSPAVHRARRPRVPWRDPARWTELVRWIVFFALLVAAALFVYLALTAPVGRYLPLEQAILHAFRQADTGAPLGPEWLQSAIRDLTALGSAVVIILLTLLILGYLLLKRQFAAAVLLAMATAGGQGASAGLKHIFARQRPDATMHLVEVRSLSFPSGHSMAASVFFLTTGALLAQTAKRRREKIYLISSALLVTALIGFSRVYLGVHYPTDVLAGWCAGTVWALLCWAMAEWLRHRGKLAPAQER